MNGTCTGTKKTVSSSRLAQSCSPSGTDGLARQRAARFDLLPLGDIAGDDAQHCVLIPRLVHHGFVVIGDRPAVLLNSPTRLYNPADEGRDAFADVEAAFDDGSPFSWQAVRDGATN